MILRVYIFWMLIILPAFIISYIKKSREILLRVVSFFIILNAMVMAYLGGVYAFAVLTTFILLLGIYELSTNYKCKHPVPVALIILGAYGAMLYFSSYLPYVAPFFLITAVITFGARPEIVKSQMFLYVFGVLVLAASAASLVSLFKLKPEAIVILVMLLIFNDVTGYFSGRILGKRRIFKSLSPHKTLEGYLGSIVGILLGIIVFHTFLPILTGTSFLRNLILLLFFFVLGNGGDLLFSKIKRSLGIKDFSSLLPGHGGILDRFDNVLSVAPLFLLFLPFFLK